MLPPWVTALRAELAKLGQDLGAMLVERRGLGPGRSAEGRRQPRHAGDGHLADARLVEPGDETGRLELGLAKEVEVVVDGRVHDAGLAQALGELLGGAASEGGEAGIMHSPVNDYLDFLQIGRAHV